MPDVSIRSVRPEDAEAVVGILNPIIEAGLYTVFDGPFSADEERQYILSFPGRGVFHVAESPPDGAVVGFQTLEAFATFTHAFDHVGVIGTAQRHTRLADRYVDEILVEKFL